MRKIHVPILAAAAMLLLAGCNGYGSHMGWGDHGGHMNGYRMDGYPPAPCTEDERNGQNLPPCRFSP